MPEPRSIRAQPSEVAELHRLGLLDARPVEEFDRITRQAVRLLDVSAALVVLTYEDRLVFTSCAGVPESWAREREDPLYSFSRSAPRPSEPLIIEDAREHPLGEAVRVVPDPGIVAYVGVPLVTADSQTLGSFCAIEREPRRWSEQEVALLREMAASALAEVQLRVESAERRRLEELLTAGGRIRERSERSAERVAAAEALLQSVAHDLNNPLHVIRNFAEMMLLSERSQDDRELLEIIRAEADGAAQVVSHLNLDAEPVRRPAEG